MKISFKILKEMVIILKEILKDLKGNLQKSDFFTTILKNEPKTNYYTLDSAFYHLDQLSEGSGSLLNRFGRGLEDEPHVSLGEHSYVRYGDSAMLY